MLNSLPYLHCDCKCVLFKGATTTVLLRAADKHSFTTENKKKENSYGEKLSQNNF